MRWRRRLANPSLASVLLAGLAVTGHADAAAGDRIAPAPSSTCRRVPVEPPPRWLASAAWDHDGDELALVDPVDAALLLFDERGRFRRRIEGVKGQESVFEHPTYLTALDGGFLLFDAPRHLVRLDPSFAPAGSVWLDRATPPERPTPGPFFAWAVTRGSVVYGFAHLETAPKQWQSGWVRMRTDPAVEVSMLRETPAGSPEQGFDLCRAGYPCAAVAGEKGYFLVQVDPPRLDEAAASLRPLKAFPAQHRRLPKLPALGGAQGFPRFMKALEQSALAVAVYGRGERVFVLTRKPLGNGETHWELVQIDPRRDEVVGTKVLPTTARHLTIAPGPRSWAIVEKGSVVAAGEQAIESMLLVPTSWIESTTSPLAAAATPPRCAAAP